MNGVEMNCALIPISFINQVPGIRIFDNRFSFITRRGIIF